MWDQDRAWSSQRIDVNVTGASHRGQELTKLPWKSLSLGCPHLQEMATQKLLKDGQAA